jgi:hypothetical protein
MICIAQAAGNSPIRATAHNQSRPQSQSRRDALRESAQLFMTQRGRATLSMR